MTVAFGVPGRDVLALAPVGLAAFWVARWRWLTALRRAGSPRDGCGIPVASLRAGRGLMAVSDGRLLHAGSPRDGRGMTVAFGVPGRDVLALAPGGLAGFRVARWPWLTALRRAGSPRDGCGIPVASLRAGRGVMAVSDGRLLRAGRGVMAGA